MKHQLSHTFISLEDILGEDTTGKVSHEQEHVFYGKISDPVALAELSKQSYVTKILQEQFQIDVNLGKNNDSMSTKLRVRRVNKKDACITRKTYVQGSLGMFEQTVEITDELFGFFRAVAGDGVYKLRYAIKPEGWSRTLELDVFLDESFHPTGYAKYDYEVASEEEEIPKLPVALSDLKHFNPFKPTEQARQDIRTFMASQMISI